MNSHSTYKLTAVWKPIDFNQVQLFLFCLCKRVVFQALNILLSIYLLAFIYLAEIEHHLRSNLLIIEKYSNSFCCVNKHFLYRIQ